MQLYSASDNAIGAAFPAFRVNLASGEQYKLSIKYKGDTSSTSGFYVRVYEYNAALPTGKLAVSNTASNSLVQEDTSGRTNWKENQPVPTDWTTTDYTYTPNTGAVWASIVILNWTGHSTNKLFIRDPFYQLISSSGPQGAQGVQGAQGRQGAPGGTGPQGVQGAGGLTTTDASTLDGLDSTAFERRSGSSGSTTTVGWYTIAVNAGNRASAKFTINDTTSSRHQSVHFYASHFYGNGSAITSLHQNRYSGSPIRYIRIKEGGTYDGALLQVYLEDTFTGSWYITENTQSSGWVVKSLTADGTNPGTVSNFAALTNVAAQVDVDQGAISNGGNINTTGNIYAGGATSQNLVWHAGNGGSGSGLDADTVDGYHFLQTQGISAVGNFGQWQGHSTYTNFNSSISYWGWNYVNGNTNAPNTTSSDWYRNRVSLGSQYGLNYSTGHYWLEMAYPRSSASSAGHMWVRTCENGSVGSWEQVGSRIIGDFIATGNVTAYSDIRLKSDIEPITDAMDKVSQISGVTFTRTDSGERQTGVIAQEVEKVFPEVVGDGGEYKSVAYGNMVGLLIEAIKEQQSTIEKLTERIETLEKEK